MAQERLAHDRWRFTLGDQPPSPAERAVLLPDLEAQGLDDVLLDLWAGGVAGGQDHDPARTRMLLLRGHDGDALAGLVPFLECRLTARRYLGAGLGRLVEALGLTCWYWDRTSAGVDGHTGPSLVAHAVDRETFAEAAVRHLAQRYPAGVVVEPLGSPARREDVVSSFAPAGVLRLREVGGEDAVPAPPDAAPPAPDGAVEVVVGPLPDDVRDELRALLRAAERRGPDLRRPVTSAVEAAWASVAASVVLRRRAGAVESFASLLRSGDELLVVAAVRPGPALGPDRALLPAVAVHARDLGCDAVQLGPVLGAQPGAHVTLRPARMRFVSRWPPVRVALRGMVPRSRVSPEAFPLSTAAFRAPDPGSAQRSEPDVGAPH